MALAPKTTVGDVVTAADLQALADEFAAQLEEIKAEIAAMKDTPAVAGGADARVDALIKRVFGPDGL